VNVTVWCLLQFAEAQYSCECDTVPAVPACIGGRGCRNHWASAFTSQGTW